MGARRLVQWTRKVVSMRDSATLGWVNRSTGLETKKGACTLGIRYSGVTPTDDEQMYSIDTFGFVSLTTALN